jgi:hypothetical protein
MPCIRQRTRSPSPEGTRIREDHKNLENIKEASKNVNVEIPYV